MTLGIFLAPGDSLSNMAKTGQDEQFEKFYLNFFSKGFEKIYLFSYADEKGKLLPSNVTLVPNRFNIHRYLYALIMPLLNWQIVNRCQVIRAYHLSGTIPAIITRVFFAKPYVFNYAYNYENFAQIENKKIPFLLFKIVKPIAIVFAFRIFAANKSILKTLSPTKAIYLPNGVDTNQFKQKENQKIKKRSKILSVGRLENQKNFSTLIKATQGINVNLEIVGKGSLKSQLLRLAREKKVNLKIIDQVPNSRMPDVYNQADIFVLPSIVEGSPKALLEAMSCGLPCVGTDVASIKNIIKNNQNGLICKANPKSIRIAIQQILKNKSNAKELGKCAKESVIKNFNLKFLLKEEIKIIKEAGFSSK